jgi:hypothetical protein
MVTITYDTSVDDNVKTSNKEFSDEVDRILNDPRGWLKYGYKFIRDANATFQIRLETENNANVLCHANGLSCARPTLNSIIIHEGNWNGNSKSQLPLKKYHNYVICHEVGHLLGLSHKQCPIEECQRRGMKECPASVMQQMTRGPAAILPCIENDWPLDPDWGIDNPPNSNSPLKSGGFGARGSSSKIYKLYNSQFICFIVILVLLVIFIFFQIIYKVLDEVIQFA